MRILFLSAYDTRGGAGVACLRLAEAVSQRPGMDVKVLVNDKSGNTQFVDSVNKTLLYRIRRFFSFLIEPLIFSFYAKSRKKKFAFSCGCFGNDSIIGHPWVKEADIIHIHWINHSFLSLENIKQLQDIGKTIIWTLHDMWAFTGICHYSGDCQEYIKSCRNCQFLRHPSENDLSHKVWLKKLATYKNIRFVATSQWLGHLAKNSELLRKFPVTVIPASIDTEVFKPLDSKTEIRSKLGLVADRIYILFGAEILSDERKGLSYLIKTFLLMKERYPYMAYKLELLVFGKKFNSEVLCNIPYKYIGELKSSADLVQVYNAADLYVLPSLQDNLPNTVIESLSCGVPVVAFQTGGIPEMVEHQTNGYLAKYQSHEDLMNGILWVVSDPNRYKLLSKNARNKALAHYSYESISNEHFEFYKDSLVDRISRRGESYEESRNFPLAANY